jgi:ribonuclease D
MTTLPDLNIPIRWVRSDSQLQSACDGWLQCEHLIIDTEFVRRRTFYPIPALLQFYDGDVIFIVDPLEISQWQPLATVMSATTVLKIFHACSEDLEVFWRLLGLIPAPLFDTQIAAGLCGLRPSMGYNKLVMALCEIDLPKDETNSDWLARPLSGNQLQYAAYDVYYLHKIYQQLADKAATMGRLDWVQQDSAAMGSALPTLIEPEQYYRRLKGAQRLSQRELAVARELCGWREQMARNSDLPRSWVLKDSAVLSMARIQPRDIADLARIKDLQASTARKQGAQLLQLVARGVKVPQDKLPQPLPESVQTADKTSLAQVQDVVKSCAEQLELAPELLMNRKQMAEATLRLLTAQKDIMPGDIGPWRRQVLGLKLQEIER